MDSCSQTVSVFYLPFQSCYLYFLSLFYCADCVSVCEGVRFYHLANWRAGLRGWWETGDPGRGRGAPSLAVQPAARAWGRHRPSRPRTLRGCVGCPAGRRPCSCHQPALVPEKDMTYFFMPLAANLTLRYGPCKEQPRSRAPGTRQCRMS